MSDERDRHAGRFDGQRQSGDDVVDSHTADLLRRALNREAARVEPAGDGLQRIRARTTRVSRRPGWLLPLAAAAAGVAVAGGVGWATMNGDSGTPFASNGPSVRATDGVDATEPPSALESTAPEGTAVALPVYYVGTEPRADGAGGYQLYREFHPTTSSETPDPATRAELALREMLANSPVDPDYHGTAWPAGIDVGSVEVDETALLITIDLVDIDAAELAAGGADEARAAASVQQLVFTATAAASIGAARADEPYDVQILVNGERSAQTLGVDTSAPIERDTATYRATMWVISIAEGAQLDNPLTVSGEANLPARTEGRWRVVAAGDTVADGTFRTDECCKWSSYEFSIDDTLAPGSYELEIFDPGAADYSNPIDTKTFTIVR